MTESPAWPRMTLQNGAVVKPALASQVRPALICAERETRKLLAEASRQDVANGGRYSAGPAGIQVWSRAWDGEHGTPGTAVLLGSIDWTYDTPVRHYATVYRSMVTEAGIEAGETTTSILISVLDLGQVDMAGSTLSMPAPPARDPFRARLAAVI